jgi:hypothetical protein
MEVKSLWPILCSGRGPVGWALGAASMKPQSPALLLLFTLL